MNSSIYNNIQETPQNIYDIYNEFIFSSDTRIFNKMVKRIELYNQVKDLNGDIIEFGVFKGAGVALFLKLKMMYEPNSLMKVIGFDYFNKNKLINSLDGLNQILMTSVLNRVDENELSFNNVNKQLSKFNKDNYILLEGEAVKECVKFNTENPGLRIKILYMDLDLGEPTYLILQTLWEKVVKNGIIVLDEYAYHKWDESNGVDKFLKGIEGKYEFINTKISSPTAYIKKLVHSSS